MSKLLGVLFVAAALGAGAGAGAALTVWSTAFSTSAFIASAACRPSRVARGG